jgi:hypothetical protein
MNHIGIGDGEISYILEIGTDSVLTANGRQHVSDSQAVESRSRMFG